MVWHEKIKDAREALRPKVSQRKLGEAIGVSQALIGKVELGLVQGSEHLGAIVDYLGLDRSEFPSEAFSAQRGGSRAQSTLPSLPDFARDPAYWAAAAGLVGDVPLYASAEGGEGSLIIERDAIGQEKRPALLQGVKDGYAIFLTGDSMVPEFEPDDVLFVNPRLPVRAGISCVFYNIDEDGPKATVKRFLSATDSEWKVQQFNPLKTFTLNREKWPVRHRIVSKNFR